VVGRAGLGLPGARSSSCLQASWSAAELGWGPAYEAHRFPAGATIGARLPLAPGGYRLEARGEMLGSAPPDLLVRGRAPAPATAARMSRSAEMLEAVFAVVDGAESTLALSGGDPLVLSRITLTSLNLCEDLRSKSMKESTEQP
jgi:hypothetical protein